MASLLCFICGGNQFRRIFTKGQREFLKCDQCSLVRQFPLPTPRELEKVYEDEYLETGMGRARADEEDMTRGTARFRLNIVQRYSPGERWLEVGCASGAFLEEASKAGFAVEGIDISKTAVQTVVAKGFKAYTATIDTFCQPSPYDVVVGFDVIEHMTDPVSGLQSMYRTLKPGGLLVLTTPDTHSLVCRIMRRHWYFYIPEKHLFYFNRFNLANLLRRMKFEVLEVSRARKALNYNYSLVQFQAYNPLIFQLWKCLGPVLRSSWDQHSFSLYIGELMIVAQKQQEQGRIS